MPTFFMAHQHIIYGAYEYRNHMIYRNYVRIS